MYSDARAKKHSQNSVTSRRSPSSHSAEKIANNEDLLTQILLNLPIKSIFRFKSVSKYWLSLISSPQFSQLRRHHNIFSDRISGLFLGIRSSCMHYIKEFDFVNIDLMVSSSTKAPFRTLAFTDDQSRIGILQSCSGMLLCCSNNPLQITRETFVYNPTTEQFAKLPPVSANAFGLSLAFDPSKSPHYKVVCVLSCEVIEGQCQVDVYSPEAREWRLAGESFYPETMDIQFDGGVFWNGSVHWISNRSESMYFNVDEERIGVFPMPPADENWEYDRRYRYFGESRGHLHSIEQTYNLQVPQFDVYEMELDYSLWTVKFRVDLSQVPCTFPQIVRSRTSLQPSLHDYIFSILCVVRDEVDEDSYLVLQIPGKVLRYDFRSKTFFKLCDVEARNRTINTEALPCGNSVTVTLPDLAEWPHVYQFIESLALV